MFSSRNDFFRVSLLLAGHYNHALLLTVLAPVVLKLSWPVMESSR